MNSSLPKGCVGPVGLADPILYAPNDCGGKAMWQQLGRRANRMPPPPLPWRLGLAEGSLRLANR